MPKRKCSRSFFVRLAPISLAATIAFVFIAQTRFVNAADSTTSKTEKPKSKATKPKAEKPKANPAMGGKSSPQTNAKSNLPPLKTVEDKLKLLEKIRRTFPTLRREINFGPEDLDKHLMLRMKLPTEVYAPPISDERFARRVYLDLTGEVPSVDRLHSFVVDTDPRKRSRLIDELLTTPEYARHWGHYWRNVIFHNAPAKMKQANPEALEKWLGDEFKANTRWDRIVCELISSTPKRGKKQGEMNGAQDHGPNNFVLAYENDPKEVAAQTARIFMGINIQCAECHDHPFDQWKREQFHQMAAFFSPGKYQMPDRNDPATKTEIAPRFLLGEKPPAGLDADARRVALAAFLVYNPDNYWFARAYVNRIWSELMGDGFYAVDSLGPDKECVYPLVINRLAAVFRNQDFDVKWVFRTIMNSQTYQRESRSLEDRTLLFSATRPSRMRPDQVVSAIQNLTGALPAKTRRSVNQAFDVDPSTPQEMLEGSLQQALLMMNGQPLHTAIAKSDAKASLLRISSDRDLVLELYLLALSRHPTAEELERGESHLRGSKVRAEAVEDLMWVLMNATEFITKR